MRLDPHESATVGEEEDSRAMLYRSLHRYAMLMTLLWVLTLLIAWASFARVARQRDEATALLKLREAEGSGGGEGRGGDEGRGRGGVVE